MRVDELFAERARARPEAMAVVDGAVALTYGRLERARDDVVVLLAEAGVPRGAVVGLRLRRGHRVIAAVLGVWRHGCAYVPIDVTHPQARQSAIMADVGMGYLLEENESGLTVRVLPPPPAGVRVLPPETAYVLYTSGSTGVPKGVVVRHENLVSLFAATRSVFDFGPEDVWSQFHSHTFDFSVWETWGPLLSGGTCVVVPADVVADMRRLGDFLAAAGVTVLDLVPSVFRRLVDVLDADRIRFPELRYLILGGEAVSYDPVDRWLRGGSAPKALLYNMYGITETTVHTTVKLLDRDECDRSGPQLSIGRPLPNASIALVADGHLVPPGTPGEMLVAGDGVAAGYLDRPDLTRDRFVLADYDGSVRTWYRSGDYAFRRPDGELVYAGRRDDQVKIRGIRIELAEVERRLAEHDGIGEAHVVPVDTPDGTELVAVLTPVAERPADSALRAWVRERLPQVFVPRLFRWLDSLPLSRNGKVDRKELRALGARWWREARTADDRAPADEVEAAWYELFPAGTDEVDTAGFLNLGGNSLTAARLVTRLREARGVEVPLSALLKDNADLSGLRAVVAAAAPAPRPSPVTSDLTRSPLSPDQRRLWLIDRTSPEPSAYNVVGAWVLRGELDLGRLRSALATVVSRRDALRARLVDDDVDNPWWCYDSTDPPELDVVRVGQDLTRDEIARCARELAARPIPLRRPPLLKAALLVAADPAAAGLVLSLHHIVSDLVSLDLVCRDLVHAYAGAPAAPAPSFARHIHEVVAETGGPSWTADLRYWQEMLADAPTETRLPFRRPRSGVASTLGHTRSADMGADLTRQIDDLLKHQAATPAMFFLAVLAVVLSAWSAQPTVVLGTPASRRTSTTTAETVGFLLRTLPIRVDVGECADFATLLAHVRGRCAEAFDHGLPSFDAIVDALAVPTALAQNPVFNVWVNDVSDGGPPVAGLDARRVPLPVTTALFELNLYLHRESDGYRLELVNAVDRVPDHVADEVLAQCLRTVRQVLERPDIPVTRISLVTPSAQVTEVPELEPCPGLVEQITEVARGNPDATAIEAGEWRLGYGSLADRIESLAKTFDAAGIGSGDVVEVRAARAPQLAPVLLALWRIDAVAAIVDATLPDLRVTAVSELTAARWVVRLAPDPDESPDVTAVRDAGRRLPGASHVLFTSGTSGAPAAVVVPGSALAATVNAGLRALPVPGDDRVALLSGLGHDPVLRDILVPLLTGGVLVVPPTGVLTDPVALARFLSEQRITLLHATPALLELVVTAAEQHGTSLATLRLVVSGGGPLPAGLVARARRVTTATIVNGYGTTETPQMATWSVVPDGPLQHQVVPISATTGTAALVVVAADGAPAGVGQRGEVVVRSRYLATGYLDGERDGGFVPDPLGEHGVRAFRTSDLGRLDPFGGIHLDGRLDRQVQVNGFRVELADIEACALRCPGVRQAVAGVVATPIGDVLALQVVGDGGPAPDRIREQLRRLLPGYAMPARIHVLAELRSNANHKVEFGPVDHRPAGAGAVPDTSGKLRMVLQVLAAVLGRPVRAEENFFEAGLNSIGLLRLQSRLQQVLGVQLQAVALFAHPSARALVAYLATGEERSTRRGGARLSTARTRRMREVRRELREKLRDITDEIEVN
ncbi:amino acid adenylation domain-containing protein [Actinophytocola sp.]|uniref:amino acid adenylation domain-containing protein n=1 Tax=Actinophytocola sp. TaxID=1872138 RepID=UPI00389A4979